MRNRETQFTTHGLLKGYFNSTSETHSYFENGVPLPPFLACATAVENGEVGAHVHNSTSQNSWFKLARQNLSSATHLWTGSLPLPACAAPLGLFPANSYPSSPAGQESSSPTTWLTFIPLHQAVSVRWYSADLHLDTLFPTLHCNCQVSHSQHKSACSSVQLTFSTAPFNTTPTPSVQSSLSASLEIDSLAPPTVPEVSQLLCWVNLHYRSQ